MGGASETAGGAAAAVVEVVAGLAGADACEAGATAGGWAENCVQTTRTAKHHADRQQSALNDQAPAAGGGELVRLERVERRTLRRLVEWIGVLTIGFLDSFIPSLGGGRNSIIHRRGCTAIEVCESKETANSGRWSPAGAAYQTGSWGGVRQ